MSLTQAEVKQLSRVREAYYMPVIIDRLEAHFKEHGIIETFNFIHDILKSSQEDVDATINQRVMDGLIESADQSRKSVVGNAFSNCLVYTFLRAKEVNLVDDSVFVTTSTRKAMFKDYTTIHVGSETQKPDMDILFYSLEPQSTKIDKCAIFSLKTSLRERAGQTYKWKLLLEIATTDNSIKDKYQLRFGAQKMPLMCFATVNFYDEINQPQHRGMFQFFDAAFIGRQVESEFIRPLSHIIDFLEKNL